MDKFICFCYDVNNCMLHVTFYIIYIEYNTQLLENNLCVLCSSSLCYFILYHIRVLLQHTCISIFGFKCTSYPYTHNYPKDDTPFYDRLALLISFNSKKNIGISLVGISSSILDRWLKPNVKVISISNMLSNLFSFYIPAAKFQNSEGIGILIRAFCMYNVENCTKTAFSLREYSSIQFPLGEGENLGLLDGQ